MHLQSVIRRPFDEIHAPVVRCCNSRAPIIHGALPSTQASPAMTYSRVAEGGRGCFNLGDANSGRFSAFDCQGVAGVLRMRSLGSGHGLRRTHSCPPRSEEHGPPGLFVPEGQPKIAQRFIAGSRVRDMHLVPSGRLRCTRPLAFDDLTSVVPTGLTASTAPRHPSPEGLGYFHRALRASRQRHLLPRTTTNKFVSPMF